MTNSTWLQTQHSLAVTLACIWRFFVCVVLRKQTWAAVSPFSLIHTEEVICRIICILDTDLKSKQKRSLEMDAGRIWLPQVNRNLAWLLEMHCGFLLFVRLVFVLLLCDKWVLFLTELGEFTLESPCCAAKRYSCTMFGSSNCKIISAIIVW